MQHEPGSSAAAGPSQVPAGARANSGATGTGTGTGTGATTRATAWWTRARLSRAGRITVGVALVCGVVAAWGPGRDLVRRSPEAASAPVSGTSMAGMAMGAGSSGSDTSGYWASVGGGTFSPRGVTRTYYIAADEVAWDYAPTGRNQITGGRSTTSPTRT
ncbi:MAG TPA: hypothetical protein VMT69_00105 [Kineosporiaceae bacterium]|nr:hypothetical protein [Kineosporiaceae bacterium]